jgi:hypothetical protein
MHTGFAYLSVRYAWSAHLVVPLNHFNVFELIVWFGHFVFFSSNVPHLTDETRDVNHSRDRLSVRSSLLIHMQFHSQLYSPYLLLAVSEEPKIPGGPFPLSAQLIFKKESFAGQSV